MTKKEVTGKQRLENLAKSKPILPVISDHPLTTETAGDDSFDLCYRLGPVFDILRHEKTRTPTTIAIYGDWGSGKTSAMRWLEGLIEEWNNKVIPPHKRLDTIWFYPWKYHDKEDVWRGLIAEVIKKSIDIKGADVARIKKAVKQFGLFLGKSFVYLLSNVSLKAGAKGIGEAEVDLASVREIVEEYQKDIHPEKGFLNDFEKSLEGWIKDTIAEDKRLIIFIDDLDRCMPEVALQVLEALKLYLNIEGLIFVVGVDRDVINPLVKKHYKELGLEDYKSDNYLAKMFQTEVVVGPSERQVELYLKKQIESIEYFEPKFLADWQKELFLGLISKLADRNPREVKRLINSAVMAGAGAEIMKRGGGDNGGPSFEQGLQVFFIRKILEHAYEGKFKRMVGSKKGDEFFVEWSKIVRENYGKEGFTVTATFTKVPKLNEMSTAMTSDPLEIETEARMKNIGLFKSPESIEPDSYYKTLWNKSDYFSYQELILNEEDIGNLMRIEYSVEIAEKTKIAEEDLSDERIVLETIAAQLKKTVEKLNNADYLKIEELDLSGRNISDLTPLAKLTNLSKLYLNSTQVSDLTPLTKLSKLSDLSLASTQVADLTHLANLTELSILSLDNTHVCDLTPLENLTELLVLSLDSTQVADLTPLEKLTNLLVLSLVSTQVADLTPLEKLTNLSRLLFDRTPVANLTPLEKLTRLEWLYLSECANVKTEDIEALKKKLPTCKVIAK